MKLEQIDNPKIEVKEQLPDSDIVKQVRDTMLSFSIVEKEALECLPKRGIIYFKHSIKKCLSKYHDLSSANQLIDTLRQIINKNILNDLSCFEKFAYAIGKYAITTGLSANTAKNFRNHLLPAIDRADDNVIVLQERNNSWAMGRGEFAIGEYTCHLYSSEPTPQLINELMLINSEIPTSIFHIFEQNRRDGLSLAEVSGLGKLKESIHDQRPYSYQAIAAMVDFYDEKIPQEKLQEIIMNHDYLSDSESFKIVAREKSTYDQVIMENTSEGKREVLVIDVLRRLNTNMSSIPDISPKILSSELDNVLAELKETEKGSDNYKKSLAKVLHEINNILEGLFLERKIGISSKLITTLSYIDRAITETLRDITFEEQVRMYRSEWFGEVVRFHDLTANAENYDYDKTSEFIRKMQQEHTLGAYRLLGRKVTIDMDKLRRLYKEKGYSRWGEMLWSGNLSHELIGITDLRTPTTQEGRLYKEKYLVDREDRLKGD